MVTIISTHPVTVRYNMWEENVELHTKRRIWDCLIKGGAGVVQGKGELYTPTGVATEVTDEAYEKLMQIQGFVDDIKAGFIKVIKNKKARAVDADEEAEKDMNTDGSGKQITASELEKDGAEITEDGNVNVTHGGKNAVAKRTKGKKGN